MTLLPEIPPVDALALRLLADAAASWRGPGEQRYLLDTLGKNGPAVTMAHEGQPPAGTVFVLSTREQLERPEVESVKMTTKGSTKPADLSQYDAVFWSEAAVEKFVIPYYASKSLWTAANVLNALSNAWYHGLPGEDAVPFALAHLPGSDYVPVSGWSDTDRAKHACWDLEVLLRHPDGSVEGRPLAKYVDPAPEQG
jgi:hypothetical protein